MVDSNHSKRVTKFLCSYEVATVAQWTERWTLNPQETQFKCSSLFHSSTFYITYYYKSYILYIFINI